MNSLLYEKIRDVCPAAARRYAKLFGSALVAATAGIQRFLSACERLGVPPECETVVEIVVLANGSDKPKPQRQPSTITATKRSVRLPGN